MTAPSPVTTMNSETFYYFAIGSMMNPISWRNKRISPPINSWAAELLDYELKFSGEMGFAEAVPAKGNSFHGVLHLVDATTMERLDELEISYKRVEGKARLNDGTLVTTTVYTKASTFGQEARPPHQRYLDLLIEGAKHYNVNQKQIQLLESYECRPRPTPHQFKSFEDAAPDAPLLSYEKDVCPFNGEDTPNLRIACNGKVQEIIVQNVPNPLFRNSMAFWKKFGQRAELVLSKIMYDPKYGCPETVEEFTKEHAAYIEHGMYMISEVHRSLDHWRVIGRIQQQYKDDR